MPDTKGQRKSKIQSHTNPKDCRILEIGALDNPTYNPSNHNIKFVDYASTDELAKKGDANPRYKRERIVNVDYVCPNGRYAKSIDERFDLIIANHVIEHVPNTLRWLDNLHHILSPGGFLFLSVPDKRYIFDIARRNTTFIDLLRNFNDDMEKPNFYQILEHFYYHKPISAADVWGDKHHEKLQTMRYPAKTAIEVAQKHASAPYADVHCHVFTSDSFRELLATLIEIDKISFRIKQIDDPAHMTNEFHVILQKKLKETTFPKFANKAEA